ncbi:hypothetical protein BV25DRAFT_1824326 [Artomyces pyxidatus]|uniref:Uncharacterized protein n=1 Tax=Artomyces pyxidatus TaxID=48021 RepID=A0ACB8T3G4_9AGAM|nr:hypothetical protein BV25DRAFT_1824326 [Artomyces pyxidatus]
MFAVVNEGELNDSRGSAEFQTVSAPAQRGRLTLSTAAAQAQSSAEQTESLDESSILSSSSKAR